MTNVNEKRIAERYYISEYIDENYFSDISIEINAGKIYKPAIADISMNGLGFILKETDDTGNIEELDSVSNCFLSIQFMGRNILTEAKKIWSIVVDDNGSRILKGGLAFSVMSPEDRLSLSEFLKSLRNKMK